MTQYEWVTVAVSALGLIGGVIGFFRSIVAGHRAAEAATRAADAESDAVAALRTSARAEERIAAALEAIAHHSEATGTASAHASSPADAGNAGNAQLAADLLALVPPREVRWSLERRLNSDSFRLRNVGTIEATVVTVSGRGVGAGAPVTIGVQSVLLVDASPDADSVDVTWRDAASEGDHRAHVTLS